MKLKEVGIRPGEKLSEMLLSEVESKTSISFDQNYFVVLPTIPIEGLQEYYASFSLVDVKSFSSQQDLLAKHEVKQMLLKGGFYDEKMRAFNNWCKWFYRTPCLPIFLEQGFHVIPMFQNRTHREKMKMVLLVI